MLLNKYLNKDYKTIDLVKNLKNKTSNTVNHLALNCPFQNKIPVLADVLRWYGGLKGKAIVFAQTKVEANSIILSEKMRNNAEVLHGDIAQNQREVTLKRFKEGKFNVLVATDVASRGLDIPDVDLVVQLAPPKEVEVYIHRSGRTARAGKEGIWITFYSGREYSSIQDIEYDAGIKFKKISPPKSEDIIKVAAVDAIENLKLVDKKILPLFQDAADKFIEEVGAREALWMALAFISETSKEHLTSRSMLTGEDGMVTYLLKGAKEIRNVSYAYKIIQRSFTEDVSSKVKGMRLIKNGEAIVFDIPDKESESLDSQFKQEAWSKRGLPFTLEKATDIPDFEEENMKSSKQGGGYYKKYQGGTQTQRYYKNNDYYNSYSNDYDYYDDSYAHQSRNYNYRANDFSAKTSEKYEAKSKTNDIKKELEKKDVSGITFGSSKPTFSRNKANSNLERPQTEQKSNFKKI